MRRSLLRRSSPSEADKIRDQKSEVRDQNSEDRIQISLLAKEILREGGAFVLQYAGVIRMSDLKLASATIADLRV